MKDAWKAPLLIAALTVAAYLPVFSNGFVFDDDLHITANPQVAAPDGFRRIWVEGGSFQYYPLTFTGFKLQHALWGFDPRGYHAVSVLLQAACAVLFGLVLLRLKVPGAWWAAALFAVHPVNVETVAWAAEQKNLWCLLFALLATERWLARDLPLALAAYAACLLSKTAACLLPFVFLALDWHESKKLGPEALRRIFPFLLAGGAMGLVTMGYEKRLLGADAAPSAAERLLIAGRSFWFYLGKLAWPHPLSFTYPRWEVDSASPLQWLAPLAAAALAAAAWTRRNRAVFAALAVYVLLWLPAGGFIPNYSNRFSFVADHYAYFAALPALALAAPALSRLEARRFVLPALVLFCAGATFARVPAFKDPRTLWTDTLAKNPRAWMAWYNLGAEDLAEGRWADAAERTRRAVELKPGLGAGWIQLGIALKQAGDRAGSDAAFRRVAEGSPDKARASMARTYLGISAAEAGRRKEAVEQFRLALELAPDCAPCAANLERARRAK